MSVATVIVFQASAKTFVQCTFDSDLSWRICAVHHTLHCVSRCRVPYLVDEYNCAGLEAHHFPVEEGNVPTMADCGDMIEQLRKCISFGRRTLLQ